MKRKDYKNYKWYPVTEETYWVEEFPDEFPNCQTIVIWDTTNYKPQNIYTKSIAYLGWGTMAKQKEWKFMIIEKP